MLRLDIEFLLDTCFATSNPADVEAEWPPQPDRVFSALVASWGARGEQAEERSALEWLEGLPPPRLRAAECARRASVTAYVPPNDAQLTDIRIMPERRRRQPRRFPAATLPREPGSAHLQLYWDVTPASGQFRALSALAADTSYVGHSASLVRCRFSEGPGEGPQLDVHPTLRTPYAGRLRELMALHDRHLRRADSYARPRPAPLLRPLRQEGARAPQSVFGERWVVLQFVAGDRPEMGAAAVWCRTMRDTLMSCWGEDIPTWLSGHQADGAPSQEPHMAVVPLGHVGFTHSSGALQGLALVLPREREVAILGADTRDAYATRQRFNAALVRASSSSSASCEDAITLCLGRQGAASFRIVTEYILHSLRPHRYFGPAVTWSSVTPIALDRHPDPKRAAEEAAEIVTMSCRRIGLPAPSSVRVHKHPAVTGALSARPSGGAPAWTGWTRPKSLAQRPLTHATLCFSEPVEGPVILGAGRFFGLGLCLPVSKVGAI